MSCCCSSGGINCQSATTPAGKNVQHHNRSFCITVGGFPLDSMLHPERDGGLGVVAGGWGGGQNKTELSKH